MLSLTLSYAAYEGEVMRGAFAGVPRGQLEAARAFGMSRWKIFRRIWLPQAMLPRAADAGRRDRAAAQGDAAGRDHHRRRHLCRRLAGAAGHLHRLRAAAAAGARSISASPASWCLRSASSRARIPHDWDRTHGRHDPTLAHGRSDGLCERGRDRRRRRARRPRRRWPDRVGRAPKPRGQPAVGLSHFLDYLDALRSRPHRRQGRAGDHPAGARRLSCPTPGAALAHPGFDRTFDDARQGGAAVRRRDVHAAERLHLRRARLFHRPARRARAWSAFAATNGPALLAGSGSTKPVYCTNPMAFAAPVAGGPPLVIDQSSSATAFVNIRKAAEDGTRDPRRLGARRRRASRPPIRQPAMKGALLAFGGNRGANIALMVEVLAAGLSRRQLVARRAVLHRRLGEPGHRPDRDRDRAETARSGLRDPHGRAARRLSGEYGVHIPGVAKGFAQARALAEGVTIPRAIFDRLSGVYKID